MPGSANDADVENPQVREPVARHALGPEYVAALRTLVPAGWQLGREGMWVYATPPLDVREAGTQVQGFKIHLSAIPDDAVAALEIAVPCIVRAGVNFKIVGDSALHYFFQSKRYPRGASSKFMTIYPPDGETFSSLINELDAATHAAGVRGPRILSDRQFGEGPVYYRYGGFWPPKRVTLDGTHETYLISPQGQWSPDRRNPYFTLPEWVDDPFATGPLPSASDPPTVLLRNRFRVDTALSFSNSGGVYAGVDTADGSGVVIKEARPHTNCWRVDGASGDAVMLLEREQMILRRLADLDFVPSVVDYFEAGGHYFLVQEHVAGQRIRSYWARDEVIVSPYVRNRTRVRSWAREFRDTASRLLEMVEQVHQRGVLIGDLSSDNVLKDHESGRLSMLDFESAVVDSDVGELKSFATSWSTPGFKNPARESREHLVPEDDYFAVGMVMCGALLAVGYFSLNPEALPHFLDRFVELGIPAQVRDTVCHLTNGRVDAARDLLATWDLR